MVPVSLCLLMSPDEMRGEFWMGATSQEHKILGAVNRGDYGRIMIMIMAPILFDNLGEIRPCLTAQKLMVDYVYDYCCNYVH